MIECKVCGKNFKSITIMHVRTHGMDLEQYKNFDPHATKKDIEPKGNTKFTPEEMEERIFGEQERDTSRPLQEFLDEFNITETELRKVTKQFKLGERIDVETQAINNAKIGATGADEYKDLDKVSVHSLHIAENLKKDHGFTCTGIKSGNPRTWFMEKL